MTAVIAPVREMAEEVRSSHISAVSRRRLPLVGDDARPIEEALARHGVDLTLFLWNSVGGGWPWAWVFFPECYPLASHIRSIRQDAASMPFAPYGRVPDPVPPDWTPCVGAVLAINKAALEAAAAQSPMLQSASQALAGCSEANSWVCLSDPLDPAWIATVCDPSGVG